MNRELILICAIPLIAILTGQLGANGQIAFAHESDAKRYNDGYSNGYDWYANHPSDGANNCDPQSLYTSDGKHTDIYCSGWTAGYTDASNQNNGNNQANEQNANVKINGNGNHVNINQQANTGGVDGGSDGSHHSNGNAQNPRCVALCLGVSVR